jgi:hypothetical protein
VGAFAFFTLRESRASRTAIFVVSAEEFLGHLSGQVGEKPTADFWWCELSLPA